MFLLSTESMAVHSKDVFQFSRSITQSAFRSRLISDNHIDQKSYNSLVFGISEEISNSSVQPVLSNEPTFGKHLRIHEDWIHGKDTHLRVAQTLRFIHCNEQSHTAPSASCLCFINNGSLYLSLRPKSQT